VFAFYVVARHSLHSLQWPTNRLAPAARDDVKRKHLLDLF